MVLRPEDVPGTFEQVKDEPFDFGTASDAHRAEYWSSQLFENQELSGTTCIRSWTELYGSSDDAAQAMGELGDFVHEFTPSEGVPDAYAEELQAPGLGADSFAYRIGGTVKDEVCTGPEARPQEDYCVAFIERNTVSNVCLTTLGVGTGLDEVAGYARSQEGRIQDVFSTQ